jgi:hypothetical protein
MTAVMAALPPSRSYSGRDGAIEPSMPAQPVTTMTRAASEARIRAMPHLPLG